MGATGVSVDHGEAPHLPLCTHAACPFSGRPGQWRRWAADFVCDRRHLFNIAEHNQRQSDEFSRSRGGWCDDWRGWPTYAGQSGRRDLWCSPRWDTATVSPAKAVLSRVVVSTCRDQAAAFGSCKWSAAAKATSRAVKAALCLAEHQTRSLATIASLRGDEQRPTTTAHLPGATARTLTSAPHSQRVRHPRRRRHSPARRGGESAR